jgi:hypothetical protein
MADVDQLIAEADRRLDENEFAAARDLYREIALARAPSMALLANLGVAEDQERLQFRRVLARRYPSEPRFRVAEAETLIDVHKPALAIDVCTQLLQSEDGQSPEQRTALHLLRFRAAVRSGRYDTLIEDVRTVWEAGETFAPARRLRQALLRGIVQLDRAEAIPVLESLCERGIVPERASAFVVAKVEELRRLSDVWDAGDSPTS